MNKIRIEALRRVMAGLSQTEFADRHDLNPSYLSQLLSGHRSFGEKAASNMEEKIGLQPGTLSQFAIELETPEELKPQKRPGTEKLPLDLLALIATPRSRLILERIAEAAAKGRITEDDLDLLDQIASRFEKAGQLTEPTKTQGSHARLREKLKSNDSSSEK